MKKHILIHTVSEMIGLKMSMPFLKFHGKMWRITLKRLLVFIQRESWKLINRMKHMIILCVVMFKSVITILLKKTYHFALLNHNFFEVGGRVIQAICMMFGYAFIKKHGWILTTICWCVAGLGSACNHVAALLFKIERPFMSEKQMTLLPPMFSFNGSQ